MRGVNLLSEVILKGAVYPGLPLLCRVYRFLLCRWRFEHYIYRRSTRADNHVASRPCGLGVVRASLFGAFNFPRTFSWATDKTVVGARSEKSETSVHVIQTE